MQKKIMKDLVDSLRFNVMAHGLLLVFLDY